MASGVKDCEEETLQTTFKKLRVDVECSSAAARICEALVQKTEGSKAKGACTKENWHGCVRKTSRGTVRSQRQKRSKSPIFHPPKFTYCSSPPKHLKYKSLPEADYPSAALGFPDIKELLSFRHASPVFGATGYDPQAHEPQGGPASSHDERPVESSHMGCDPLLPPERVVDAASDFQSLSRLQEGGACSCALTQCQYRGWQGTEVYSFTGLRDVISTCERNLTAPRQDLAHISPHRWTQTTAGNSGSPRSCSEQARVYVDDITIEDLSGYMEYYLYMPKKMSHMAEMMYT